RRGTVEQDIGQLENEAQHTVEEAEEVESAANE
ncbi:MAG: hypothetical protein J07AB43_07430, partial [Candidatus Nanosalina sp. J07AB43]